MKKTAILMVLMLGLLALAGCSSDNESSMLDYDLLANIEDVNGGPADGAEVTINSSDDQFTDTKTADENGVVQFKDLASDAYKIKAEKSLYKGEETVSVDGRDITARVQLSDKLYLYSADSGSSYDVVDWSTEAEISEISKGNYDNVFEVKAGSKWGVGALVFTGLSESYTADYESVTFKVKSDDLDQISVKIPEVEKNYTIENGTDLGDGWYELTLPFSDFEVSNAGVKEIGIQGGSEAGETFYITDVYFKVDSSNSGSDDEDPVEGTPLKVAGVANSSSTSDTVSINWGAWSAGDPAGDENDDGWDESVTKYEVVHSTSSSDNPDDLEPVEVSVNNDGSPSFPVKVLDGTATAETDYFVWVRAVNENGAGAWSEMATITTPEKIEDNPPTTVPNAPSLDSADVISIYNSSDTYTNINVTNWNPDWGQAGSLEDYDTGAGTVKKLDLQNYQGVEFETIDITGKSTLHISYYTTNATTMDVTAIDGGEEIPHTTETLTTGEWTDLEIDLSDIDDLTNVSQLKFEVGEDGNPCQIYMDNIYFH